MLKNSLVIILIFFLFSCAEVATKTECNPNPCKENNKTQCKIVGQSYACFCNSGFHDEGGICVSDSSSPCEPNPCLEENRNKCVLINGQPACTCSDNFHSEEGQCISNTKIVECDDVAQSNIPENGHQVKAETEIYYQNGIWTIPEPCEIACDSGFGMIDKLCLNSQTVQCLNLPSEVIPENAHEVVTNVQITYSDETGWSQPENCIWECDEGYTSNGQICGSNSRVISCENVLPENAVWTENNPNGQLTQIFNEQTQQYEPSAQSCEWNCNVDFHKITQICESNTKTVSCTNNLPEHGIWNENNPDGKLRQTYNEQTQQYEPSPDTCLWNCEAGYFSNGTVCGENGRVVACTNTKPLNSVWDSQNPNGQLTQVWNSSTNQYEPATDTCGWNCNTGFHLFNNLCENNVKTISCTNSYPANSHWSSQNSNGQLTQNWNQTTQQYEPDSSSCLWECDSGFLKVGNTCQANGRVVACTNSLPSNAVWSSDNANGQIAQSYNSTTGQYEPAANTCTWNCNTNYHKNVNVCDSNIKIVSCTNTYPANSHWNSQNPSGQLTQNWNSATNQYEPASNTCVWECDTNYTTENNLTCINKKNVDCSNITPPSNAHQNTISVEITFNSTTGWAQPASCTWSCDTNYITEDSSTCINRKFVDCLDITPPLNGHQVENQVEITYTTSIGWSQAAYCVWECNTGYSPSGNSCVQIVNCTDSFENNNTVTDAKTITDANNYSNQHTNLYICEGDEDWYKIDVTAGSGVEIDLNYTHTDECDVDMELYTYVNGVLTEQDYSSSVSGRETVYIRNVTTTQTYYLKVFPYDDICPEAYDLTANIFNSCIDDEDYYTVDNNKGENDDVLDEAKSFTLGTSYQRQLCDYDDDFYSYYFNAGQKIKIGLTFVNANGDLDLALYNSTDSFSIAATYGFENYEEIKYDVTTSGNYYIKVRGWSGSKNSYTFKAVKYGALTQTAINHSIPDNSCTTKTFNIASQIPTSGTITNLLIKNLKIEHTWVKDLTVKIKIGSSSYITIWEKLGGTTDGGNDDDTEDDDDIQYTNRNFTGLNGSLTGDGILTMEICDAVTSDTGKLQEFDFELEYK